MNDIGEDQAGEVGERTLRRRDWRFGAYVRLNDGNYWTLPPLDLALWITEPGFGRALDEMVERVGQMPRLDELEPGELPGPEWWAVAQSRQAEAIRQKARFASLLLAANYAMSPEQAETLLPSAEGFAFGDTDFSQIAETVDAMTNRILPALPPGWGNHLGVIWFN